jgi:FkbH-like protein
MALRLRSHGVVLAVSSKNDEEIARRPFQDHPDMLIQESDIAMFQANWTDKASNLESIASALDIGIDALVLLDDNPAERAQVRQALPAVAVPELPDNPALFTRTLLAAGYFETVTLSNEDLLRADDYSARAKRAELMGATRDLSDYLASLEMEITFGGFDTNSLGRIEQLINKSNQFNLTTKRYTRNEISEMVTDPAVFPLQVRLRDRFGDNGMISVVICRDVGRDWEIDTWLMSCRVLGRGVEQAVLAEISRQAISAGKQALVGRFIPSGRNDLVKGHYEKLGFDEDGGDWRLDLTKFDFPKLHMRVTNAEFA